MSIAKSFVSTKTLRKSQIEKIVEGTYLHRDYDMETKQRGVVFERVERKHTHSLLVVKRERRKREAKN